MKIKLLFGIFIPILVIAVLIILSSTKIGFSIEKETEKSVDYNSLFTTQTQAGEIKIQTIAIKNDFFLTKKIELPKIMVCLYDKDNKIKSQNIYVRYNEGKASEIPQTSIAQELGIAKSSYYGYSYYAANRAVEVPSYSKTEVKLMVQPKYTYNYDYYNKNYADYEYDELLIIEPKDKDKYYSYNSCANLDDKDIDGAVHTIITNIPDMPKAQTGTAQNLITALTQKTTRGRDISECDRMYGSSKDNCYYEFALGTNNVNLCEIILTPSTKHTCYSGLASTYGNLSLCYKIPPSAGSMKDFCIANTARTLNDNTICNSIQDETARNYCFQLTKNVINSTA